MGTFLGRFVWYAEKVCPENRRRESRRRRGSPERRKSAIRGTFKLQYYKNLYRCRYAKNAIIRSEDREMLGEYETVDGCCALLVATPFSCSRIYPRFAIIGSLRPGTDSFVPFQREWKWVLVFEAQYLFYGRRKRYPKKNKK